MKTWQLWREDKAAVTARLEEGGRHEGHSSAFGGNDLITGRAGGSMSGCCGRRIGTAAGFTRWMGRIL
jgi:hypothetical protein